MKASSPLKRLTIACLCALPLVAQAFPHGGDEPPPHCGGVMGGHAMPPPGLLPGDEALPPHLHGLNLSAEQRDQLFALRHEQTPLLREKAKAARKAMEALHALAASPEYTDASAQNLAETAGHALAEIALLHTRNERQIHALLSEPQRKQLAALKARRDAHLAPHPH